MSARRINLLPPERVLRCRAARRHTLCAAVSVLYLIALAAASVVFRFATLPRPLGDAGEMEYIQSRIGAAEQSSAALRGRLGEIAVELQRSKSIRDQPNWGLVLAIISEDAGDEVIVTDLNLKTTSEGGTVSGASLKIQGLGRTRSHVTDFASSLQRSGLFADVSLQDTSRRALGETEVFGYTISCTMGEAARGGAK